jgi:hypothetical protein
MVVSRNISWEWPGTTILPVARITGGSRWCLAPVCIF